MSEKYIYCPSCCTLTIHNRLTGTFTGWLCQDCNPPLDDWVYSRICIGGESDGESE